MENRKRKADPEIAGYIHGVTPLKTSKKNNRYFNAIIQTNREEFHSVVVYHSGKHEQFSLAEKRQTPVILNNATKIPSKYLLKVCTKVANPLLINYPCFQTKYVINFTGLTESTFDVQCTKETSLEITEVPFPSKTPNEAMPMDISSIKLLASRQRVRNQIKWDFKF